MVSQWVRGCGVRGTRGRTSSRRIQDEAVLAALRHSEGSETGSGLLTMLRVGSIDHARRPGGPRWG